MSIRKSDRKSFFIKVDLDSTIAWRIFDQEAKFNDEEVVVLQVMQCTNNFVIVELILKEDYCRPKYYNDGKGIGRYKNESNM